MTVVTPLPLAGCVIQLPVATRPASSPPRAFAENVAYDSRTGPRLAQLVVQGWIDGPEHRANLEGRYDLTGIGVAVGRNGRRDFTQIFVGSAR